MKVRALQLNCCGAKTVAVKVRSLQLKSCLYGQHFFFQYRMDFTETACVFALLLRIRKDRCKKRHWVHPVVSKRLLNGQFYKLYKDLRNCRGKFFNYFRMSCSFQGLLRVADHKLHSPDKTARNFYDWVRYNPCVFCPSLCKAWAGARVTL